MTEQLVSFEMAKVLSEKDFNEECNYVYNVSGEPLEYIHYEGKCDELQCTAPTQSFAQKWLRDEHGIHIEISREFEDYYLTRVCQYDKELGVNSDKELENSTTSFKTYELALEEGLKEALKLI